MSRNCSFTLLEQEHSCINCGITR